jgi:hypothetical protein
VPWVGGWRSSQAVEQRDGPDEDRTQSRSEAQVIPVLDRPERRARVGGRQWTGFVAAMKHPMVMLSLLAPLGSLVSCDAYMKLDVMVQDRSGTALEGATVLVAIARDGRVLSEEITSGRGSAKIESNYGPGSGPRSLTSRRITTNHSRPPSTHAGSTPARSSCNPRPTPSVRAAAVKRGSCPTTGSSGRTRRSDWRSPLNPV